MTVQKANALGIVDPRLLKEAEPVIEVGLIGDFCIQGQVGLIHSQLRTYRKLVLVQRMDQ